MLGQGLSLPAASGTSVGRASGTALPREAVGVPRGSATAWPPVLHKDDVVESTTSRPLHTVGTYGEAEPGQEGSSQGCVGVGQQHPPASHGSGAQGDGVESAQDGHVPPGAQGGHIPWG